jgi:hypothetical protein
VESPETARTNARDRLEMNIHGTADSHMDALCHAICNGALYNGVSADTVTPEGATALAIDVARDGVTGRGVLLDSHASAACHGSSRETTSPLVI